MRELNEGKKGERVKALEYYKKYAKILEGLDCIDNKLWTDETKIKTFSDLLEGYCEKCVKLVDENNRNHLERLKLQRDQRRKEYEEEQARYDREISELEKDLLVYRIFHQLEAKITKKIKKTALKFSKKHVFCVFFTLLGISLLQNRDFPLALCYFYTYLCSNKIKQKIIKK